MERDEFLSRVRAARAAALLPRHPADDPGLLVPELEAGDLVDMFTARVHEAEGIVHRVSDLTEASGQVVDIARRYESQTFMSWDGFSGVDAELAAAGLRRVDGTVPANDRLAHQSAYSELDLGITGAEAGFAESGTIVLRSGPGRPRMASLIPLVHVALVGVGDLHRSLSHWAEDHAAGIADAANVVFITGPSKTGDIEQHINVGVHGPRYVHVLLHD
ncbi:MAG: lactate utilization protein [Acidimicrobiia bacterium]